MPTYDYECRKCKHIFEEFQSITSEPGAVCPKCGKKDTKRLIGGGAGIIFKGSGFYTTDYKKSSAASGNSGSSESKSGDSSKESKDRSSDGGNSDSRSESKSESKSEGKSESKSEGKSSEKNPSKTN